MQIWHTWSRTRIVIGSVPPTFSGSFSSAASDMLRNGSWVVCKSVNCGVAATLDRRPFWSALLYLVSYLFRTVFTSKIPLRTSVKEEDSVGGSSNTAMARYDITQTVRQILFVQAHPKETYSNTVKINERYRYIGERQKKRRETYWGSRKRAASIATCTSQERSLESTLSAHVHQRLRRIWKGLSICHVDGNEFSVKRNLCIPVIKFGIRPYPLKNSTHFISTIAAYSQLV